MSGTAPQAPAPAPVADMKRIPLPYESYQHPSSALVDKRLVNFYAEHAPNDARSDIALISSPGLLPSYTLGTGPIYAMCADFPGSYYIVSGSHFFRIGLNPDNTTKIEDLGDIGGITSADFEYNLMITIAVGVQGAIVCVPPNAFYCAHEGPLSQLGGNFPGARTVAYQDGYFIFTANEISGQFFTSLLLNPTNFDALDFAYADGVPNVVRRIVSLNGDIWLMGNGGLEPWYDAGAADFPFRSRKVVLSQGVSSPKTIVKADSSLFYYGEDGIFYRTSGYQALRISTHAIEAKIREAGGIIGAQLAFSYTQDGHTFICWTFGQNTIVYDCATKLWHERASGTIANRWTPSGAILVGDVPLLGDHASNQIWYVEPNATSDNTAGTLNEHQITCPPLFAETDRAFMHRLEIGMETGGIFGSTSLLLEWSDDGGVTFPHSRTLNLGAPTNRRKRVVTNALGSFRERVLRITTYGKTNIYSLHGHITTGSN